MKTLSQLLAVTGIAALLFSAGNAPAQDRQGRGNWDPEEMRQRMMERVKEQLEITNNDEWTAVQPLVQKVMDARREAMASNLGGMMRGFGRGPRGGDNATEGDRNRRPGGWGEPSPEAEALDRAIEAKATREELKAAMEKFRAAKKQKEAALKESQDNLRKVLTVRQEAIAMANGWLD